tara:strand:+ start:505 stop:777 length:273 start_codon:yes stop_codon:yes gene_type:complete
MLKEEATFDTQLDQSDASLSEGSSDQFASPYLRKPKEIMTRQEFHEYYVNKHGAPPRLGDQTYVKEYIGKLIDCIQYNHNILQDDYSNNI